MTAPVRVRPADLPDRPSIAALLDSVLGPQPYEHRVRLWDWRTPRNPARPAEFPEFLIAESDGRIVGVHGLIPLRLRLGEDSGLAACSCDFAVAPTSRGAGLPLKMAAMASTLSRVALSTSANAAAGRLTVALRGAYLQPAAVRYLLPLKLGGFLANRLSGGAASRAGARIAGWGADRVLRAIRRFRRPSMGGEARVREVTRFDSRFDDLWNRQAGPRTVGVLRDAAYLAWRYSDYPFGGTRSLAVCRGDAVSALAVLQFGTATDALRVAVVAELLFPQDNPVAGEHALAAAVEAALSEDADYLVAFAPSAAVHAMLARAGFRRRVSEHSPFTYRANRDADRSLLDNPDNWWFSLGDGDASYFLPAS